MVKTGLFPIVLKEGSSPSDFRGIIALKVTGTQHDLDSGGILLRNMMGERGGGAVTSRTLCGHPGWIQR